MSRMNYSKIRSQKIYNQVKAQEYAHAKSFKEIKLGRKQAESIKRIFSTKHKCRAIINCKFASVKQKRAAELYINTEDKKYVKLINSIAETLSNRLGESMIT